MQSIQNKEQLIIGTIISCNNEIKSFINKFGNISNIGKSVQNLMENEKFSTYHFNMMNLYSEISDIPFMELNENYDKFIATNIYLKNNRNNYFSYFSKVHDFLIGYETGLQKNLNESLNIEFKPENSIQLDIYSFKNDLKKIIEKLLLSNDLENLPKNILKIKTFAKMPILIYGYDICNNLALNAELQEKFGINQKDIISICFDKSNKQLLFLTSNTNKLVCYDLKQDILDFYNIVNKSAQIQTNIKLEPPKHLIKLKELLDNNNIFEIYIKIETLNLSYNDNLYYDNRYTQQLKEMQAKQNSNKIVK